ncbi:MAG: hypothetical protein ACF8SC_08545 [Phycisphaerales bacterium JB037]
MLNRTGPRHDMGIGGGGNMDKPTMIKIGIAVAALLAAALLLAWNFGVIDSGGVSTPQNYTPEEEQLLQEPMPDPNEFKNNPNITTGGA